MWWDSDASLTSPLSQQVLQGLQSCGNSVVMGWGPSEIGVVQALAQHGVAIHASDWAVNIATYASFYVPVLQQRRRRARAPAKAAHTVTFLLSDGDNLQVRSCNSTCIMHAADPASAVACGRQLRVAVQRLVGQQHARRGADGLDHQPRPRGSGAQHTAALLP